MNFIKRALLSTVRKKGKSFILLVTIFILGNLIAGSIAVKQATSNVEKTMKASLGAKAVITFDWSSPIFQNNETSKFPKLSDKTMEEIGKFKGVKYYEYNLRGGIESDKYKGYYGEDNNFMSEGNEYFEMYGVQVPELVDIKEKVIALKDGRTFKKDEIKNGSNVVMVSTKFAEKNNIHVGDTLSFIQNAYDFSDQSEDSISEPKFAASRDLAFEVIGIFDPSLSIKEGDNKDMGIDYSMMNRFYAPNALVRDMQKWSNENTKYQAGFEQPSDVEFGDITYYLNDSDLLTNFKKDVEKLLPEGMMISVSSDAYDQVAGPIAFISWLATGILYISIAATVMILGLVVVLFLRDRRHEFGIYLSIGTHKWKIVSQVVIEVLLVGLIGLTLSLFTGNMLAKSISSEMIDKQKNQDEFRLMNAVGATGPGGGNGEYIDQNDVLDSYEVKLSMDYILLLYGIGISTLLVSAIAPTVYVVRLKPRKVLM